MTILKALIVGVVIGAVVRACGLPAPSPPTLAGVVCVAGLTLGFYLWGLR